jgi:gliding motility-associated protein GldL
MEKIVNVIASFAAAVVIFGALAKILHWNHANEWLMLGMLTEVGIFAMYGVLYLVQKSGKDYEWERVYPELSKDFQGELPKSSARPSTAGLGLTAKMDDMMANANITPDIFNNLGKGMKSLTETVSKIGDITDATVATSDYAKNVKASSATMTEMNKSYGVAMSAMSEMASASGDAKEYKAQFQKITQNMGALNAVYELELQDSNKHLKAMNSFYTSLTAAMENMSEASKDTQQFKTELSKLTNNLNSLNNVYGSMLSAMKGN